MILLTDIIASAVFSFAMILFGYASTIALNRKNGWIPAHYVLILSITLGSFTIVFSGIVVGTTTVLLVPFYKIFTALLTLTAMILLVMLRKRVRDNLPRLMAIRRNPQAILALIAFSFYAFKIFAVLSIRPILDGDALYLWIPMGKVFFLKSSIPVFDDYHFWTFTAEPGVSLLYTWAYSLSGSVNNEVFRLIPAPFLLSYPILIYALASEIFRNGKAAFISMILACFIPLTDFITYLYAYYPDIFAATFSMIAVLFTLRAIDGQVGTKRWMIGIPLALSLLFKYAYGIITVVVILFLYFTSTNTKGRIGSVRLLMLASFLLVIVLAGDKLHSYLCSPYAILAFLVLAIAVLYTSRTKASTPFSVRKIGRSFPGTLVFLLPLLLWNVRTLFINGSLFGVSLIRILPMPATLQAETFPMSSATTNFSALSPITFLILPWTNLYFAVIYAVIICCLLLAKEARRGLFLLFLTYFLYLTVLGHITTGRHLLLTSYFLLPLAGLWLAKFSQRYGNWALHTFSVFYSLSSILQYVTYNLYLSTSPMTGTPADNLAIPYQSTYSPVSLLLDFSFQIITLQLILASLILIGLTLSKLDAIRKMTASRILYLRKLRTLRSWSLAILFITVSISSVLPYLCYVLAITGGNTDKFDEKATWYIPDIAVANDLKRMAGPTDVVLTVSDVMLSYYGLRVIDLEHGGLAHLTPITDSRNSIHIAIRLASMNVRFLLIPGPKHYAYDNLIRVLNRTGFLEATLNGYYVSLLKNYYDNWLLYTLESPEKTEIVKIADFDSEFNVTYIRSDATVNDTFILDRELYYQGNISLGLTFKLETPGSRAFKINLNKPLQLESGDIMSFLVYGSNSTEDIAFMIYDLNGNWRRWWFVDNFVGWRRMHLNSDSFQDQSEKTPELDFIADCRFYKNVQQPSNKTVRINIDDIVLSRQKDALPGS